MIDGLSSMMDQIVSAPMASLSVILNLILIESLLSVDNAAVLATMVLDLPKDKRKQALRYGILGAYIFRGIALFFAALLIQVWWFKPLGGVYLLYIAISHFLKSKKEEDLELSQEAKQSKKSWIYRKTLGVFGHFWATVILVELMDLAFSIDNVIAANAYTKNLLLIWVGVFIGILSMRFVAQGFVRLLEKYPFLTTSAYLVIFMLGLKLSVSIISHYYPCSGFAHFMDGPAECLHAQGKEMPHGHHVTVWGDIITSIASFGIFVVPILTSWLFNWPKRHIVQETDTEQ